MTNIRLLVEDTIPAVGLGSVGHSQFSETSFTAGKGLSSAQVTYRMARVTPARVETI